MLPEITKKLLLEYLILFLILGPATILVIFYHLSLPKEILEEEDKVDEDIKEEKTEVIKPTLKKKSQKADIDQLYRDLKKKYNPAKAGDKKTRLRNKQMQSKIEKAYKMKDIKSLQSL